MEAINTFIDNNVNFKSSVAIEKLKDDIKKETELDKIVKIPMQHKMFDMTTALNWCVFLFYLSTREEGEGMGTLSLESAITLVHTVFDLDVEDTYGPYFGDEEESDDEEESEDDDEESEDEAPPVTTKPKKTKK
jgi:hypothetical protein